VRPRSSWRNSEVRFSSGAMHMTMIGEQMFEAGTEEQIQLVDGNWIFLDVGFSGTKKTCGLVIGDAEARCVDFAEAKNSIIDHLAAAKLRTNLVVEAPLSVSFRNGLPAPRSVDKRDGKNRFWYVGLGCGVMVASMYLIKAIKEARPPNGVRLFEAFVSFKEPGVKSDHKREVELLREIVRDPKSHRHRIVPAEELKEREADELMSAFGVIGIDCGVPAVIILPPG
jgi:hypothetical protein